MEAELSNLGADGVLSAQQLQTITQSNGEQVLLYSHNGQQLGNF